MKYLLLSIGLCLSSFVYAQFETHIPEDALALPSSIIVEKGAIQTNPKSDVLFKEILLQDTTGFYGYNAGYSFKGKLKYFLWTKFNSNMDLVKQQETEFKYNDEELFLIKVKSVKGKIYIFLGFYNQKDSKTYIFVQSVNKNTLELNNDLQKIAEVSAVEKIGNNDFDVELSKDSTKILVYGNALPSQMNSNGKAFMLTVLDKDVHLLWNKSIVLPYSDKLYDSKKVQIDNDGNVYLLGKVYTKKRAEKNSDGEPNYINIISSYTENGSKADEFKIDLNDKVISNLSILSTDKGEFICAGMYADKATFTTAVKGIFTLKLNVFSRKIESESYSEFDQKTAEHFFLDIGIIKRQIYELEIRKIVVREDGGAYILAELSAAQDFSKGQSTTSRTFSYEDIVVVSINAEGTIDWVNKIPKKQVSDSYIEFLSFTSMITKDKLYLVYNDNPKNLTIKTGDVRQASLIVVVLVEINSDGTWNKYPLYLNSDNHNFACPKISKPINKNQLIIEGNWLKKYNFTRVTFK